MALSEYGRMTWPEVEALDRDRTVVVVPMGSIEQHGHHGPLATDALVSLRLVRPLAEAVPEMTWLEMPPIVYGYAKHSAVFPGTVSVEASTLTLVVRDVLRGICRQGFRKVVMLNSHYENAEFAIDGAAQALEAWPAARALLLMWWEFVPDDAIREIFGADWRGWLYEHAGLTETSLMLHCAPELVRMDLYQEDSSVPSVHRFRVLPWDRGNFAKSGSTMGAGGCSAARGRELLAHVLRGAAGFIREQFGGA